MMVSLPDLCFEYEVVCTRENLVTLKREALVFIRYWAGKLVEHEGLTILELDD